MLTKLSLFSGIGGDDLASDWAGINTVCFVERDKYCQQVLRKHWPDIPIIGDVKDVTYTKLMGWTQGARESLQPEVKTSVGQDIGNLCTEREKLVDIISGGFPCQPHSVAGKRKASSDERDLWPEFRRIIGEIKPRWVVAENVPGLFSSDAGRFFGNILADLAALGYAVGWCTFGAVDVGAWHRRDRVFIVAHTDNTGNGTPGNGVNGNKQKNDEGWEGFPQCGAIGCSQDVAYSQCDGLEKSGDRRIRGRQRDTVTNASWWSTEPNVGRVAHGVSRRVDRLRALGNAVVPQQIYPIYKAIVEVEYAGNE
jgi:DNA (cytosine-5)-methyltransferase 1